MSHVWPVNTFLQNSVPVHFNLMFEKYKAKRRNEARCSGVNVEDSKLERQRGGNKGCLFHQQTEG